MDEEPIYLTAFTKYENGLYQYTATISFVIIIVTINSINNNSV